MKEMQKQMKNGKSQVRRKVKIKGRLSKVRE